MSNPTLDRIREELRNRKPIPKEELLQIGANGGFQYQPSKPISTEELQEKLSALFIQELESKKTTITSNIKEFPDIFHFVEWYQSNQNHFNDKQKTALNTLVEAKDLINVGCACKRTQRLNAANNYFQIFFSNNTKNDLLPTILQACQCQVISFGNFLTFPTQ